MRGEHTTESKSAMQESGSSPHARGARKVAKNDLPSRGIIPACAGSTVNRWVTRMPKEDHPRMRGEHGFEERIVEVEKGSSPHARGARKFCHALI